MTFRNAAAAKTISDNVTVETDTTLDGVVGVKIDLAISSAASTTKVRTEKINIDLDAVINGRKNPIEIVQDGGNLKLDDVLKCISNNGFRVSVRYKKSWRVGGQDRVTLTIAWD